VPQPGILWVYSPHAGCTQPLKPGSAVHSPHPCPFHPTSVGKTSLLHQYVHKTFYEDYRTTLGASILTKVVAVDKTPLKLQVRLSAPLPPRQPCPQMPGAVPVPFSALDMGHGGTGAIPVHGVDLLQGL